MANDIFISYSRKDTYIVNQFVDRFRNAGFVVWIDEKGIESGEAFKRVITQAIMDSQVFVFFSSEASNKSEWTAKEIGIAAHLHKHIIPVKLDDSSYNLEIMFDLINIDFIDFTIEEKKEGMIEKLISSISRITGKGVVSTSDNTIPDAQPLEFELPELQIPELQIPEPELPELQADSMMEDSTTERSTYIESETKIADPELPELPELPTNPVSSSGYTTGYKVRLKSGGYAKLSVLKVIKDNFMLGLAEAKALLDSAPVTFEKIMDKRQAEQIIREISNEGGTAELISCNESIQTSGSKIHLIECGDAKLHLIKFIKESFGISLSEAYNYVNSTPIIIDVLMDRDNAEYLKAEINHIGGRAEIV